MVEINSTQPPAHQLITADFKHSTVEPICVAVTDIAWLQFCLLFKFTWAFSPPSLLHMRAKDIKTVRGNIEKSAPVSFQAPVACYYSNPLSMFVRVCAYTCVHFDYLILEAKLYRLSLIRISRLSPSTEHCFVLIGQYIYRILASFHNSIGQEHSASAISGHNMESVAFSIQTN